MKDEVKDLGGFKVIHIIGTIDSAESTKILDHEISRLIPKGHHHFVLNLRKATFLDSGGIGLFIHSLCDVKECNGSVFIIAEDNQVRKVLEDVGITRLIKTYYSEQEFSDAEVEGKPVEDKD